MDRRQVLIGSGAVAVATTASWTPEASAGQRTTPLSETIPPEVFPPFEDGLHGTYTFRAVSLDLNGSMVPL